MSFEYRFNEKLPRLAWCAELTKGAAPVIVRHGPWVETRAECFFEGAWNGACEAGRFDSAHTFVGSGARLTRDGVLFAAPTHPVERIYSVRTGDRLLVSNSWVFLLVASKDQPDLSYADYFFDLRHNFRNAKRSPTTLRTQQGNRTRLHDCHNFLVAPDLSIRYIPKVRPQEPATYAQFVDLLRSTVRATVANAAHPARRRSYRPVTMTSTGYDSTAVSVLASEAGCTESVTFARVYRDGPDTEDDGSPIAQTLNMKATTFARYDYRCRADLPEAEFCTTGPANWAPLSAMEQTLVGSLLFTGEAGYDWHAESYKMPPYTTAIYGNPIFSFTSLTEFRLRVGLLEFPALHIGAVHDKATRQITLSAEMRPWVLPDKTDNKPILRRILEEAGVPRSLFGQQKHASAYANLSQAENFAPASWDDFTTYCAEHKLPATNGRGWRHHLLTRVSRGLTSRGNWILQHIPPPIYFDLMPCTWWLYPKTSHPLWRDPALYTFHWGFERTKQRYQVD